MARILVIDDNAGFRDLLRKAIETWGHEAVVASSGEEGIRINRENPADVVIADIVMPGMEGIETMVELRKDYPDVNIIAVSGGGFEEPDTYLDNAMLVGGAKKALAKPFSMEEMKEAIDELILKEKDDKR